MIATDEAALICDLAETYHIYDYKSLPAAQVAIFSVGLRDDSRIKMKMRDMQYPLDTMLKVSMVDHLANLLWMQTQDAVNGTNRPTSIMKILMNEQTESDIEAFDTPESFEKRKAEILKGGRC